MELPESILSILIDEFNLTDTKTSSDDKVIDIEEMKVHIEE